MQHNDCPFERALQTSFFQCKQSQKVFVGEKENVVCTNPPARLNCHTLVAQLKKNARFALKLDQAHSTLTHGQEMKLKCGGLQGLQLLKLSDPVATDVNQLIQQAVSHYQDLAHLPYPALVQSIASYQLRKQPRKNK